MSEYLFSYGTLLPEHAPTEIAATVAQLRRVGKGSVRGVLYDLGEYPGAILGRSSKGKVSGTVFELPEPANILRKLDKYEGFKPRAPRSSLFLRTLRPVTLTSGRKLRCWVYMYNKKPGAFPIVASGRYGKKAAEFDARKPGSMPARMGFTARKGRHEGFTTSGSSKVPAHMKFTARKGQEMNSTNKLVRAKRK